MNGVTWQGAAARIGIVAEGTYHASEAAALHEAARAAAACLLLLLCRHCEGFIVAIVQRRRSGKGDAP